MTCTKTLVRHVLESNAIEGIFDGSGTPLFEQHLHAACLVEIHARNRTLTTPIDIHQILLPELGGYRTGSVSVGDRIMPQHESVPELMAAWTRAYVRWHTFASTRAPEYLHEWVAERAMVLNHWLLCIHPFEDGNGRTARLILNSFRRTAGMPWHIVLAKEKQMYYDAIRTFEDKVFSGWDLTKP